MEERKQKVVKGQFYCGDGFSDANDIIPDHGMHKNIFFIIMTRILLQEPHMKRRLREVQR